MSQEPRLRPDCDGTFPQLLVGPIRTFFGAVALGNGSVVRLGAMRSQHGLVMSLLGIGAAEFTSEPTPEDVLLALDCSHDDARNLADLVCDQFTRGHPRCGTYLASHCDNAPGHDDTYRET